MADVPVLRQVNLVVRDMAATLAFYRRLGWSIETTTRREVDERYAELVAHGGRAHQPPYDAFWGARYAIVDDPDGNPVGLMSPVDERRKSWPPAPPPGAGGAPAP